MAELMKQSKLVMVGMGRNDIGDAGGEVLAKACEEAGSVTMLLVDSCKIGDKGGQGILNLVKAKKKLVCVSVKDNLMGGTSMYPK